jgi:spore coat protein U-like protein
VKPIFRTIAATVLFIPPITLSAGTQTVPIPVSATIVEACTSLSVSGPLSFGSVGVGQAKDVNVTLTAECAVGTTSASVGINDGLHAAGGVRRMQAGVNFLPYELLKSVGGVWGDVGTPNAQALTFATTTTANTAVRGRITAAGSNVPVGNYTDTLTVTLNF